MINWPWQGKARSPSSRTVRWRHDPMPPRSIKISRPAPLRLSQQINPSSSLRQTRSSSYTVQHLVYCATPRGESGGPKPADPGALMGAPGRTKMRLRRRFSDIRLFRWRAANRSSPSGIAARDFRNPPGRHSKFPRTPARAAIREVGHGRRQRWTAPSPIEPNCRFLVISCRSPGQDISWHLPGRHLASLTGSDGRKPCPAQPRLQLFSPGRSAAIPRETK
jgi:hypothetical protein